MHFRCPYGYDNIPLLLETAPGERQLLDVKDTTTHIVAGSYEELLYLAKMCMVHMIRKAL